MREVGRAGGSEKGKMNEYLNMYVCVSMCVDICVYMCICECLYLCVCSERYRTQMSWYRGRQVIVL